MISTILTTTPRECNYTSKQGMNYTRWEHSLHLARVPSVGRTLRPLPHSLKHRAGPGGKQGGGDISPQGRGALPSMSEIGCIFWVWRQSGLRGYVHDGM